MLHERVGPINSAVLKSAIIVLGIGTLLLAAFFGSLGVELVKLGAKGATHIKIFGGTFETTDVGIGSLCVAAVIVIAMLMRISGMIKASGGRQKKEIIIYGDDDRPQ
jgi:hypothetical protein